MNIKTNINNIHTSCKNYFQNPNKLQLFSYLTIITPLFAALSLALSGIGILLTGRVTRQPTNPAQDDKIGVIAKKTIKRAETPKTVKRPQRKAKKKPKRKVRFDESNLRSNKKEISKVRAEIREELKRRAQLRIR
jgi:hypothetical protein